MFWNIVYCLVGSWLPLIISFSSLSLYCLPLGSIKVIVSRLQFVALPVVKLLCPRVRFPNTDGSHHLNPKTKVIMQRYEVGLGALLPASNYHGDMQWSRGADLDNLKYGLQSILTARNFVFSKHSKAITPRVRDAASTSTSQITSSLTNLTLSPLITSTTSASFSLNAPNVIPSKLRRSKITTAVVHAPHRTVCPRFFEPHV